MSFGKQIDEEDVGGAQIAEERTYQYAIPTVIARSSSRNVRTNSTKAPGTGHIESISVMHCITPHANAVRRVKARKRANWPDVLRIVPLRV